MVIAMSIQEGMPQLYFGGKKGEPLTVPNLDEVIINDGIKRVSVNKDGTSTITEHPIDVANSGRGESKKEKASEE